MTTPTVEQQATEANGPKHTGGMVALIPADTDALVVESGEPSDQLHLTLVFLGEDVTDWPEENRATLERDLSVLANQVPLIQARVFGHAVFNPDGYADRDPCAVYLIGDGKGIVALRNMTLDVVRRRVDIPDQHDPFSPHITAGSGVDVGSLRFTGPVTFDRLRVALASTVTDYPLGGETMDEVTAAVARTKGGSVTSEARDKAKQAGHAMKDGSFPIEDGADLDNAIQSVGRAKDPEAARRHIIKQAKRLGLESRIPDSWASDGSLKASAALDDGQREALTAAVGAMVQQLGPVDAHGLAPQVFQSPESLAFADTLIELPLDDDDVLTAAGTPQYPSIDLFVPPKDLPPGSVHYVDPEPMPDGRHRVYGRLGEWDVPHIGIDGNPIYIPRSPSGYRWFHTKGAWVQGPDGPERIKVGHLTFGTGHAPTRGVNHLAAAAHYDNSGNRGAKVRITDDDKYGPVYAGVTAAGLSGARLEEFGESDQSGDWRRIMGALDLIAILGVNVGGFPKVGLSLAASGEPLALVASAKAWGNPAAVVDVEAIAAAVVSQMERRTMLTRQRDALLAALDDSDERMAELLDELEDDLDADEVAFIDSTPDPTGSEIDEASIVLTAAVGRRGTNWVEQTGTGHLPRYITRIKKHLMRKGMTESRAIAVAVNVVKRMCATGDLNFKGIQRANPKSRAEACAAVAEWEAKKAQARAT